ncbi:MAG TPA: hypothetical protein VK335_21100 [Bryobacteraceae bacterium]|nr:hypothetical protein [Bryobacteraceae bacterium]
MRKLILPVATFFFLAAFAMADVSGKWSGSAELQTPDGTQTIPITAEFKQQDKSVSGTTGKEGEEQYPIEKGQIDGSKLIFEFTAPEGDEDSGKRTYNLRLNVISESQLQGEFDFLANGTKVTGMVKLARAK